MVVPGTTPEISCTSVSGWTQGEISSPDNFDICVGGFEAEWSRWAVCR